MATLVDLDARIEQLRYARDSGVLTVRHGETSTTFRDLADIERVLRSLESEKRALLGRRRRRVSYVFQTGKGY